MSKNRTAVVIKGAGDLASGVAYRLHQCGLDVLMTELSNPLVVRRNVSFAEAIYEGSTKIEGITAKLSGSLEHALILLNSRIIPVLIDPQAEVIKQLRPTVVIDARMAKRNLDTRIDEAPLVIGLGPGFVAEQDVDVVIETCRGHKLGRVIYSGSAVPNTNVPGAIDGYTLERLLRAPVDGQVLQSLSIGELVEKGDLVAFVEANPVHAEIAGVIRGMIKEGVWVSAGTKIGDIDPRKDTHCDTISDKALAIGGGVLEAVFHFLTNSEKSVVQKREIV